MGMGIGERFRVTLFGESHGKCVGALLEGMPVGTKIDSEILADFIYNIPKLKINEITIKF